jgi:hypothetical protein
MFQTAERELVQSRIDHYQTPSQVHVSVYAKQVDKSTSSVKIEEQAVSLASVPCRPTPPYQAPTTDPRFSIGVYQIHLDLHLPQNKRMLKTLALFGPINPETSSFAILGTKAGFLLPSLPIHSHPFALFP